MKIKFNGMKIEQSSGRGCPVCGKSRVRKEGFVSVKSFILPSGLNKTFRIGNIYEVNDKDGKFLLQYKSFEKVK